MIRWGIAGPGEIATRFAEGMREVDGGTVISVGNGKLLDDGTRGQLQVKANDRVLFTAWAGETFKVSEEEFLLMREEDILAILED